MELFQLDDHGHLYLSPAIEDWASLDAHNIDAVIDLESAIDTGIPTAPDHYLYIYYPIQDEKLPDLTKLHAVAKLGASLVMHKHRVLTHCCMGFNRSALMAGLILCELGHSGPQALERVRERRPGALFNETFAEYLVSLK